MKPQMHLPRQARKKTKTTVLLIMECKYSAAKNKFEIHAETRKERKTLRHPITSAKNYVTKAARQKFRNPVL